jgi:hypothetical protein
MGSIDDEEVEVPCPAGQKTRRSAEEAGVLMKDFGAFQSLQHGGIAWHERDGRHALLRERRRQGSSHIGQSACLDDGKDL